MLELKGQIESKAEKEMTDAQRQYVLRQQMKAIQTELGEGDGESSRSCASASPRRSCPNRSPPSPIAKSIGWSA